MIYTTEFIKNRITITNTGCWEWNLSRDKYGYGVVSRISSGYSLAHRLSYSIFQCDPVNNNVLHKCDNPPCVNPEHLFLGTQEDNMRDAIAKGRKVFVRTKLTSKAKAEIAQRLANGEKQRQIAKDLGISESYLSNIKHGNKGL